MFLASQPGRHWIDKDAGKPGCIKRCLRGVLRADRAGISSHRHCALSTKRRIQCKRRLFDEGEVLYSQINLIENLGRANCRQIFNGDTAILESEAVHCKVRNDRLLHLLLRSFGCALADRREVPEAARRMDQMDLRRVGLRVAGYQDLAAEDQRPHLDPDSELCRCQERLCAVLRVVSYRQIAGYHFA